MISNPSADEKYLIFKALIHAIATNSGIGFHNQDQGHPAYEAGAQGDYSAKWGDGPDQNKLFQLLKSFPNEYYQFGPNLSDWQSFCAYAVESYRKVTGR